MKSITTTALLIAIVNFLPLFSQIQDDRDIHYYMMDKKDKHLLPAVPGRTYLSSDEKIALVAGNSINAVADGDCVIYALAGGQRCVFARVTVGWQVQNPVLPYAWDMYIPDSEVHNFGGQLYVYGSLDAGNAFCSPHYMSLTTKDVRRWESHGYSFSSADEGEEKGRVLWDSDGHYYNGKYLLYGFYEWNAKTENYTFVLESDDPMGKFHNFRWMTGKQSGKKIDGISAEVFVDDDNQRYVLYAPTAQQVHENYPVIAKLVDDAVIDETAVTNLSPYIKDFYEAPSLRKRGDTYYFVYAENCGTITDGNHTPKRLSYATSKHIFGPYTYRGVIITVEHIEGNSNIQGSIEPLNGQWYVFYHRAPNAQWNRRALCVEKISFDKDGLIIPVEPSSSGIAEGLNTSKPIYFNTSVIRKNSSFSGKVGKYGGATVKDSAEIGFRYVSLTGKEKQISLQG
ncbi:MAG: family 43 glycosylhydrolase, partial [Prevotella sp.]|nr:family 43 glycosylhydrolase [Prevotella sp.]